MFVGMIGLGRMGANMVRRLMRAGHECAVFDLNSQAMQALAGEGAIPAESLQALVDALPQPRVVWLMLPAAIVDGTLETLAPLLAPGDILVDGGNSHYVEDIRRAKALAAHRLHYVDVGTSGGVWGLERGYCLMIGGQPETFAYMEPIFQALAPGKGEVSQTPGRQAAAGTAEQGYLHCGQAGAGHFVKMVHNGIEYGIMAAYAEGFNILRRADIGKAEAKADAETAPLEHPEHYQYDFPLGEIAELWRRGSVVSSWLLDLTASALAKSPTLDKFKGSVSDSVGEGRWTVAAAIDQGTPAPVLSAALFQRFSSRGQDEFACKVVSAMRYEFGGHGETS